MKKLSRKLFLSFATLALAITATVTTTYAWFTMNAEVTVSQIAGGSATVEDGIYVSLDGITYGTGATLSETASVEFQPVTLTSENQLVFLDASAATGADFNSSTSSEGAYAKFTLYFKVTQASTSTVDIIAFSSETSSKTAFTNTSTLSTVVAPIAGAQATEGKDFAAGSSLTVDILDALRLSTNVTVNSGTAKFSKYTVANSDNNLGGASETGYAARVYQSVLGSFATGYAECQSQTDLTAYTPNTTVIASDIKNGDVVKVDFMLWLEGWDADCFNAVAGQSITMDLAFAVRTHVA